MKEKKPLTEAQKRQYALLSIRNKGAGNPTWKGGISLQGHFSDYHKAHKRQTVLKYRAFVRSLKDIPCADCKIKYGTWVMDFDHRDATQKKGNISQLVRARPRKETILAEVAKCDVVCANCHRERTHKRQLEVNARAAYTERVRVD